MCRMFRLVFFGIVSILAVFPLAGPAAAISRDRLTPLCRGDCDILGSVPVDLDVSPFDFVLGSRAIADGLEIRIKTPGSVFILGNIRATGDIWLRASEVYLQGGISAERNLILETPGFSRLPIDGPGLLATIGEELTGGFITSRSRSTSRRQPEMRQFGDVKSSAPRDGRARNRRRGNTVVRIHARGDIYIDVSGVTLSGLRVRAGGAIITSNRPLTAVPEPSAALMLGLGLSALSAHRSCNRGASRPKRR